MASDDGAGGLGDGAPGSCPVEVIQLDNCPERFDGRSAGLCAKTCRAFCSLENPKGRIGEFLEETYLSARSLRTEMF